MTVACTNAAAITFPKCTSGAETITHVGVGTSSSGAGKLIITKSLASNLAISNNIQPQFPAGDLDIAVTGNISDTWISELLTHLFVNEAIELVGDAAGLLPSAATGSLYVSLHTAAPTTNQSHNEAVYGAYARVAVARTAGGWTIA